MIEIVSGTPTDEELAAIIAALSAACHPDFDSASFGSYAQDKRRRGTTSIWAVAGRYPDLEYDDLRALAKSNRVF